jgi:plasmid stability protein
MEAEAREILQKAVGTNRDFIAAWLEAASGLRGEFEVPPRSLPRDVDLS